MPSSDLKKGIYIFKRVRDDSRPEENKRVSYFQLCRYIGPNANKRVYVKRIPLPPDPKTNKRVTVYTATTSSAVE